MDSSLLLADIQQWFTPVDSLLRWLSLHTLSHYYLLVASTLYLTGFACVGVRIALTTMLSALTFGSCRHFFPSTRPYWDYPQLFNGHYEKAWGMPSGHTQNATLFWGILAFSIGKKWAWAIAALMITTIALSRLYLGVHYPLQILAGLMTGLILLTSWITLERSILQWLFQQSLATQLLTAFLVASLPLVITLSLRELALIGSDNGLSVPYKNMFFYSGLFQSAVVSLVLAYHYTHTFSNRFSIKRLLLVALPALLLSNLLWKYKFISLTWYESHSIIYTLLWLHGALITCWTCLLWPWVAERLNFAQ